MLHLLGLVISIGFADGMNPTSIGPSLYLASGRHPRRSVLQFAAGYFVVLLVGGLVLALGPGSAILALVPKPSLTTRYVLETIAGVAMLIAAAVLWWRRESLVKRESEDTPRRNRRSPALMGATISAVELPTAFPYFAAIAAIVGSGLGWTQHILLVAIYDFCFILPVLAIVVTLVIAGDQAVRVLVRVRALTHRHWPATVAVVAAIAGAFVTTLGATGLELHAKGNTGRISREVRHLLTH